MICDCVLTFSLQLTFLSQTWCLCRQAWPVKLITHINLHVTLVMFSVLLHYAAFHKVYFEGAFVHAWSCRFTQSYCLYKIHSTFPQSVCIWGLQFLLNMWVVQLQNVQFEWELSEKLYTLYFGNLSCKKQGAEYKQISTASHLIGEPWFLPMTWFFWAPEHTIWEKSHGNSHKECLAESEQMSTAPAWRCFYSC